MQRRDISFPSPQENILFDEVLWCLAEKHGGGEFLRFWESSQIFIVLGRIGKEEADVDLAAVGKDNIPVLRRSSGGGTVVQGPGCLNYTLILSKQKYPVLNDLGRSYQWIGAKVIAALRQAGVEAFFRPTSDLAAGFFEQKFSGNAQRRGRHYILHHGTILYNFDLTLISRYLNMPRDIPEYRKHRPHTDFVANVSLLPADFKNCMAQIFSASEPQAPCAQELSLLKEFLN
jgi:lipoate-protein ligase A